MVVMKFGGTSVENAAAMRNVVEIVRREHLLSQQSGKAAPLVVTSACAGITNQLFALGQLAASGKKTESREALKAIKAHHQQVIADLLSGDTALLQAQLSELFEELSSIIRALTVIGELTPRLMDSIAANGELFSSLILAQAMQEAGLPAAWLDAREVLITDDHFGKAQPLDDEVRARAQTKVLPLLQAGKVVVTQGYIGATLVGQTTTLGRGGSDYSASIFGAALDAESIQIWTDVDGVMTCDPRLVPNAKRLKVMTFREAAELAYFGAKVLHPSTIRPAVQKNIPVYVLNSKRPHIEGTLITQSIQSFDGMVKSIAHKTGQVIINLTSTQMLDTYGFLYKVARVFADAQTPIDMISTSEVSISLTIGDTTNLERIIKELETIAEVEVERDVAIICVVGDNLRAAPGVAGRIFSTLAEAGINIKMISQGASEINIGFVVAEQDAPAAVRALHREFFSEVKENAIFA
ncbi:MAG: lysine-sensitive aspartokinase 3 [Chloroherpetonaceae bacterium]|nr:lysine-sensitive aspartokinase 3 [Chloroherpetonaceae bacterium]MCS7210366.1 lysine-sensitive aspartokinase 3 [Chloroherpetonaceae bacterium]MDW8020401.1 lysine-sensitive aspartokinase 3 [Chloroherpetonaceae bacterium]MDW8466229.1 lysine-sensitive aspartokinase 3 [Chloroherpetonaceae bacterium]